MKKIASLFVIWSSFLISATPVNADWSHWFINNEDGFSSDENNEYKISTVNNESGEKTLRTTHVFDGMILLELALLIMVTEKGSHSMILIQVN